MAALNHRARARAQNDLGTLNGKNVPFHPVQTCKRSCVQMRSNSVLGASLGTAKMNGKSQTFKSVQVVALQGFAQSTLMAFRTAFERQISCVQTVPKTLEHRTLGKNSCRARAIHASRDLIEWRCAAVGCNGRRANVQKTSDDSGCKKISHSRWVFIMGGTISTQNERASSVQHNAP